MFKSDKFRFQTVRKTIRYLTSHGYIALVFCIFLMVFNFDVQQANFFDFKSFSTWEILIPIFIGIIFPWVACTFILLETTVEAIRLVETMPVSDIIAILTYYLSVTILAIFARFVIKMSLDEPGFKPWRFLNEEALEEMYKENPTLRTEAQKDMMEEYIRASKPRKQRLREFVKKTMTDIFPVVIITVFIANLIVIKSCGI